MEATKTKFQVLLTEIERLLEDFKNAYPKSYGAMILRRIPVFMLIMAVLWTIFILYSRYNELVDNAWIALVILIYLFFKCYRKTTPADSAPLEQKIQDAKDEFGEYPDVLDYLEKTAGEIAAEKARKKHINIVVKRIFGGVITVAAVITAFQVFNAYSILSHNISDNAYGIVSDRMLFSWHSNDIFYRVLECEPDDDTFLSLQPLKTQVSDTIYLLPQNYSMSYTESSTKEVMLGGITPFMRTPNIALWDYPYENEKLFLVTITDLNGNPVPKCPDFLHRSYHEYSTIPVHSETEKLRLLYYLQENQDSLRFVVEEL
ncbi:MAG: hypothetical protein J6T96_15300 [Bacteroidales bacterium]|nr:hypothetical protein [Bacteroidales bacterium]MBO7566974.1 hypothetical protein [Bacteroidales bacterium]